MIADRMGISGTVRGGVVVPNDRVALPEGMEVEITFDPTNIPVALQEEFEAWNRLSAASWSLIDDWEQEPSL